MRNQIFLPCIALVALTALVWVRLYIERIGELRARRISPQTLATSREASRILQRTNAADNFHSFIHATYNRVNHRFAVYVLSTLLLFSMWLVFGVRLLSTP